MNTQFRETQLICPYCGHIIGSQAFFQSFEVKVAKWLNAEVAPPATRGFDVWRMEGFEETTFQVKYSSIYRFHSKNKQYPSIMWTWQQKSLDPLHPDYYILFGIDEEGIENCFLLSREHFLNYANTRKDGTPYLRVSAKKKSDRKHYNYIPKIWKYHVPNPEDNLRNEVIQKIIFC